MSFIRERGACPTSLKQTINTRNLNDGPKADITTYRPIASLYILSLAYGEIVYATVSKHLHNKLSSNQFGFESRDHVLFNHLRFLVDFLDGLIPMKNHL